MSSAGNNREITRRLVEWYAREARDLPWRRRHDPYAVWVSEVMLQQTRVETVCEYYKRWMAKFPDAATLAGASVDDVLKAWEGMGYYRRARNLHAAARVVVDRFNGELPADVEQLRELPGVGRYTAGAIASIAFGADEPVLDGNVTRVLSRLFCMRRDVTTAPAQKRLWKLARDVIPPGRAGEMNQAMMDLGATICRPRSPRCQACPVAECCVARARGLEEKLPLKKKPAPTPHYNIAVGVLWRGGRLLIDRRPADGLLGGLWELPGGKIEPGETAAEAVVRELREEVGVEARVEGALMSVRHAYTHFRITMHVFECRHVRGRARAVHCDEVRWVRPGALDDFAFPAANKRVIARLRERR